MLGPSGSPPARGSSRKSWAHPTAFGGLQGHSVGQAVDTLLQAFQTPDAILVSIEMF